MENPLVSIILISMNHEKFIAQACYSALNQTYSNIEIIFLDNKSDDKTFEIGNEILSKGKFPYKGIQNTERFGVSKNLNTLVSYASGEYISILSGDDWYANNIIERKLQFLENNKADILLSDGYKYIQETGETKDVYKKKEKSNIIESLDNFFEKNVTENKTANVGTFIKRELLIKEPFDENVQTEDWDMNLRLTSKGYQLNFVDEKLFFYRILNSSLSRNIDAMEESYRIVTNKYIHFINTNKKLKKEYLLKLLFYKYEKLLQNSSEMEKKRILKAWKIEKNKIKNPQPLRFFKNIFLKLQ
ncbi:MAG: glycosyltransferase family 2 protein [Cloacibacterium sp.]|nr:glycosyltransferase family 2 protein [Cloacibacterium sp.]